MVLAARADPASRTGETIGVEVRLDSGLSLCAETPPAHGTLRIAFQLDRHTVDQADENSARRWALTADAGCPRLDTRLPPPSRARIGLGQLPTPDFTEGDAENGGAPVKEKISTVECFSHQR
jgi:hypothetical protein